MKTVTKTRIQGVFIGLWTPLLFCAVIGTPGVYTESKDISFTIIWGTIFLLILFPLDTFMIFFIGKYIDSNDPIFQPPIYNLKTFKLYFENYNRIYDHIVQKICIDSAYDFIDRIPLSSKSEEIRFFQGRGWYYAIAKVVCLDENMYKKIDFEIRDTYKRFRGPREVLRFRVILCVCNISDYYYEVLRKQVYEYILYSGIDLSKMNITFPDYDKTKGGKGKAFLQDEIIEIFELKECDVIADESKTKEFHNVSPQNNISHQQKIQ